MDSCSPLQVVEVFRRIAPNALVYYTNGGCYDFFLFLKTIFPEAEAWSDCDHVITKIGEEFYDITGKVEVGTHCPIDPVEESEFLSRLL